MARQQDCAAACCTGAVTAAAATGHCDDSCAAGDSLQRASRCDTASVQPEIALTRNECRPSRCPSDCCTEESSTVWQASCDTFGRQKWRSCGSCRKFDPATAVAESSSPRRPALVATSGTDGTHTAPRSSCDAVAASCVVSGAAGAGAAVKQSQEQAGDALSDGVRSTLRRPTCSIELKRSYTGLSSANLDDQQLSSPALKPLSVSTRLSALPRAASLQPRQQGNMALGMLWYGASSFFLTGMGATSKVLANLGYPVWEITLARAFVMLPISLWAVHAGGHSMLGNRRWLLFVRGTTGYGSICCFILACKFLPLADATTFTFLAPLVATLSSPLILHERPGRGAAAVIPVCIVGVLLITQPSFLFGGGAARLSALGVTFGLLQPFFSAAAKMTVRILTSTEELHVMVLWLMACTTVYSTVGCLATWHQLVVPSTFLEITVLVASGLLGYGNQVCITMGLANAKAAPVMCMQYLSIVVSQLVGMAVFREFTEPLGLLGMGVVVGSMLLYIAWETRAADAARRGGKV